MATAGHDARRHNLGELTSAGASKGSLPRYYGGFLIGLRVPPESLTAFVVDLRRVPLA